MTKPTGWLAAALLLAAAAMPFSALAQDKPQEKEKKQAPAAAPAKPAPAPAARPAPPPAAARPAPPPPAAARPAPPPPAARPAPPPPAAARPAPPPPAAARPSPPPAAARPAPPPPAAARPTPPPAQRAAPVQPPAQRQEAVPRPPAPAVDRAVREQRRIERAQRRDDRAPRQAQPQPQQRQATPPASTPQPQPQQRQATPPTSTPQLQQRQAISPAPTPQQTAPLQATPRQLERAQRAQGAQQREERVQRRREDLELRRLPPPQRAQRREEIDRNREQRALERRLQQRQQQAQPPAAAPLIGAVPQRDPAQRAATRALRRSGQARVTPPQARAGRFAAPFAATQAQLRVDARNRPARIAARRAWRQGQRAAFVAWYGPVFWPYAYSDIFDYAFWPGGYEDGYWAYAYDDFFDGVFWGEVGPPVDYAYAVPPPAAPRVTYSAVQSLCKDPGGGITAWPFAEIERRVGLNAEQKQLLGEVRAGAREAAATFRASCPSDSAVPLTPPGRLQMMTARLDATLEAVETVRPALERFYNGLSDEQKERFNAIGPGKSASAEAREALPDDAKRCAEAKPGLTNLPIEQIEDALNPSDAQLANLDRLAEATVKAVGILQAACPTETPLTPPGRLEAMEKRLQAMIEAAETVKPALDGFYGSLSNEQKARFNRLGRDLAQTRN